jgi:hypothetical protein
MSGTREDRLETYINKLFDALFVVFLFRLSLELFLWHGLRDCLKYIYILHFHRKYSILSTKI